MRWLDCEWLDCALVTWCYLVLCQTWTLEKCTGCPFRRNCSHDEFFSTLWNLYAWRGARELTCISSKGKLISHIDPLSGLMMCRRDFPHSCPTNSRFLRHVMSWIERVHRAGLLLHRLCTAHFDTFCDYEKSAMIGITRVFLGNALSMTDFILIWKLQSESKSSTPVTIARKCQ